MTGRAAPAAHSPLLCTRSKGCHAHTALLQYDPQGFWKQKAATTLDSTISVTQPKISSQRHSYLTSAVSLCKNKKNQKNPKPVLYFSKTNAIVKSWQKIRVTTTLPKR